MNLPAEPPHELAARYGLGSIQVPTITGKTVEVTPFELGRMVADGLGRFCRSAQLRPEASHIPVDEKVHDKAADWLRESLLPCVVRLWNESTDPRGRSAIAPDVYPCKRGKGNSARRSCAYKSSSAKPAATIEASCRARDSASERIAHTAPVDKWRPLIARHRTASRRASFGPRAPHEEYCVAPNPGLA